MMRPIDVQVSEWDCILELCEKSASGFEVRMGLRYVKGLGERDWDSIAGARHAAPFTSVDDFVSPITLDEGILGTLAEAGAFDGFNVDRRTALWDVRRRARTREESLSLPARERTHFFEFLSSFEEVKWDYRTTSHSPRRHPLAPIRASLTRQGLPDARTVASMKNGENVRYAGLVICRQRPGGAGGVVFMTLEDETGFVNVVVWESIFQRYSVLEKPWGS
jgi:error-prone DNA polymerase